MLGEGGMQIKAVEEKLGGLTSAFRVSTEGFFFFKKRPERRWLLGETFNKTELHLSSFSGGHRGRAGPLRLAFIQTWPTARDAKRGPLKAWGFRGCRPRWSQRRAGASAGGAAVVLRREAPGEGLGTLAHGEPHLVTGSLQQK